MLLSMFDDVETAETSWFDVVERALTPGCDAIEMIGKGGDVYGDPVDLILKVGSHGSATISENILGEPSR